MTSTDYTKQGLTSDQAKDRLATLDNRLGEGVGAVRERAHLQAIVDGKPLTFRKPPKSSAKKAPAKKKSKKPTEDKGPSLETKLGKALKEGNLTSAGSKRRMDRKIH